MDIKLTEKFKGRHYASWISVNADGVCVDGATAQLCCLEDWGAVRDEVDRLVAARSRLLESEND